MQIKYVRYFVRHENKNQYKISTVDGADAKKAKKIYNFEMIDLFFSVIYNCKYAQYAHHPIVVLKTQSQYYARYYV